MGLRDNELLVSLLAGLWAFDLGIIVGFGAYI